MRVLQGHLPLVIRQRPIEKDAGLRIIKIVLSYKVLEISQKRVETQVIEVTVSKLENILRLEMAKKQIVIIPIPCGTPSFQQIVKDIAK